MSEDTNTVEEAQQDPIYNILVAQRDQLQSDLDYLAVSIRDAKVRYEELLAKAEADKVKLANLQNAIDMLTR